MNANMDNIYYTNSISEELKHELEVLSFVRSIGVSTSYPGNFPMSIRMEGESFSMRIMECDSVAFSIFGFKKIQEFNNEDCFGYWMSENAANKYNITEENPVWAPNIRVNTFNHVVPGIIKDIPTREILNPNDDEVAIVKVGSASEVRWGGFVLAVEQNEENRYILDSLVQSVYFNRTGVDASGYGFLRDLQKDKYDKTIRDMRMLELFMAIAIMLSSLAFLAMSMHYATGNTKQVAIHKVFGGSTWSESVRCMAQYFKIMAVAIVLSLPLAVWISSRYLEQFAEKITLGENWWIFVASAIILMLISTATVLIYTIRAARTNPVEALKKE
jgi:putative ABC transport system permease protein